MIAKVVLRPAGRMGRIFVMDQVHRVQSVMPSSKVFKMGDVVFGALRIQANRFHLSAVNDQKHKQVDGAMADVFEFSLLNRSRNRASDRVALQDLEIRNFIYANHPLALLCQFRRICVAPEDFFSTVLEIAIQAAGFPIACSMGMEIHLLQNAPNHAGADGLDDPARHRLASQVLASPMCDVETFCDRLQTGQSHDLGTLQRGKYPGDVLGGDRSEAVF